ncbi:MAG: two component system sensor histidine kinase, hybrid [Deltaproteobacteria bacterium]|nr:two component system sensor histidine kinase, hybrid [Deltaproteobacteria bacterium]
MASDANGQGKRIGGGPRDLAEAEAALRESEERYRSLVETISDWVWEVDENVVYTFVSPKVRELLGYEPGEVLGKSPFDLMPPAEALRVKEILLPYAAGRKPLPAIENINVHKDGHLVLLETSGVPFFDANGTFRGYRGVDRDIGARKRAEEELRKSEEHLRQVQRFESTGRLAGGLAHHLNNLMTVVTGYSDLLLARMPKDAPLRGEIVKIREAGERAAELTRELLSFGRRQILRPLEVDLNGFLSQLSSTLEDLLGRSVRLTFSPGDIGEKIHVDPDHLRQVMTHLAANARNAMPGGGELRISTAPAELNDPIDGIEPVPGRYVLLCVQDTGNGMDAETRERIFEPFYFLNTGSEGMGLPSVYGFVKQSGGYIFVESRPGHGTTFRIYFPYPERAGGPIGLGGSPPAAAPGAG